MTPGKLNSLIKKERESTLLGVWERYGSCYVEHEGERYYLDDLSDFGQEERLALIDVHDCTLYIPLTTKIKKVKRV